MGVLLKLNQARKQFHATKIEKTGNNKFAGYKYFELGDFLIPALSIFDGLNLSAVVSFGVDIATMTLTDLDDGSQFVITSPMSTAALKACHEVQNLGAVQTYLRRYLWVAALEIVEHDALDATTGKEEPAKKQQPQTTGSATRIAFENLPADWKDYLSAEAPKVVGICAKNGPQEAAVYITAMELDEDQHAGLWSLLDSKTRSAINALTKGKTTA